MNMMKRTLAMLLALTMVLSFVPASVFAADTDSGASYEPTLLDATIFFSDLHTHAEDLKGSSTDKTNVINGVFGSLKESGMPFSTVNSCGDVFSVNNDSDSGSFAPFTGLTGTVSGWIRDALGDSSIPVNYTWSDHDRYAVQEDGTTALSEDSGFVYGAGEDGVYGTDDDANYYVYSLSMADIGTSERYCDFHEDTVVTETINAFKASAAALKSDRPILIASHMPLYDNRNDNGHAYEWAVAINEVAETKDVVYFHGHNHKYDAADGSEYYFAKGSTMSVCNSSSGSATNVKLNFTHVNAGYLEPKSSTSYNSSTTRMNVAISVVIYDQYISLVTYGTDGKYTGSYALDARVDRMNVPGGKEEDTPAAPGTSVTDPATGVTVSASNITALSVQKAEPQLDAKYHTSLSYDISPVGYTQGTIAAVTIPVDTTVFDVTKPVYVLYDGEVIAITNIADGKVTFTTDHFSVYTIAQTNEEIELDENAWQTITAPTGGTTTYTYTQATSITAGGKYVIVANGYDVALQGTTSLGTQSVTINGTTMTSTTELTLWTFSANSNGTNTVSMSINNGSRYLRYSSSSFNLNNTSANLYVSDRGDTFRIQNSTNNARYFYYNGRSWTRSNSGSAQAVRLYQLTDTTTTGGTAGLYAQATGGDSVSAPAGSLETGVINTVKQHITVYTTADTANGSSVTMIDDGDSKLTWTAVQDTTDLSKWTVTVKYDGQTLKEVEVSVLQKAIAKIEPSSYNGQVERGSTETDTNLIITYEDGTTATTSVTTGMITEGTYNINKNGTYSGLTISYGGYTFTDYTLKVVNVTGVEDYPAYPNPGSVQLNKTATGLDFQNTGLTRVELSASGLPSEKGVDVVVVIDTSSSMEKDADGGTAGYNNVNSRYYIMKESLEQMLIQFQTPNATTGVVPDIDIALIDFNGFRSTLGTAASLDGTNRTTTDNAKVYYHNANGTATSTLIKNISGGLTADYFMENTSINAASIKALFTGGNSGTNYDGAFQNAYDLLAAKQAANAAAGETREQFVIFMSDGASFRYNGFMTGNTGNRDRFDQWLDGIWEDKDALDAYIKANNYNQNALNYTYLYNGAVIDGVNVHLHRMAEAIKGDPNQMYEVVLDSTEKDTDGDYLFSRKGLGAKIYSIGFCMQDDTNSGTTVKESTLREVIKYLSSGEGYYVENVTTKAALVDTFKQIAAQISLAASNARYVDQLGSAFELQMNPVQWSNDSKSDTVTETTDITITTHSIYTEHDVGKTINGHTVTQDDIGKPYGTGTILETVSFTFSSADPNLKTPSSVTSTAKDGNILIQGVIYAQYFFYNTTSTTKVITLANGQTYNLPGETFYWNIGSINEQQFTLSYTVYLTGALGEGAPAADSYATNNFAILYYDNYVGNEVSQSVSSPTMAWSGAKVSYAFYLVNSEGKPVYKDGSVAPNFYTAYKVTQPVVYSVVELNQNVNIIAGPEAEKVLPEGYSLYDPDVRYEVGVASGSGDGAYHSYWSITSEKDATYVTGYGKSTDYTNQKNVTTDSGSSNYVQGYDFTNTTVWFPVLWIPSTIPDTVVIDFGLPVDINALDNDQFGAKGQWVGFYEYDAALTELKEKSESQSDVTLSNLNRIILTADKKLNTEKTLTGAYGDISFVNGKVRYTPHTTEMKSYDRFVYEVSYPDENGVLEYYYGVITVIPATSVYYEESLVQYSVETKVDGTWSEDGTKQWETVGSSMNESQDEDRPGQQSLPTVDANNIYGYDSAYENCAQYSMGAARKITANATTRGKATFTFWGTGFDIISITSGSTGLLLVDIEKAVGDNQWEMVENYMVDTYYGYTYSGGEWVATGTDNANALYQVPVIKAANMEYGRYKVTLHARYSSTFDHVDSNKDTGSYELYLDAIRIYDPANNGVDNSVIENAYKADGEGWPVYHELRNWIISKDTLDSLNSDDVSGIVFIDGIGNTSTVENYRSYGPNNEVYLAKNQGIAFKLNAPEVTGKKVASIQLGIKTVGGENAKGHVLVTGGDTTYVDAAVTTATEMYYNITGANTKNVIIKSTGDTIISITNVKVTYTEAQTEAQAQSEEAVVEDVGVSTFSLRRSAPVDDTMTTEEEPVETVEIVEAEKPMFSVSAATVSYALQVLNTEEELLTVPALPAEPEAFEPEKLEVSMSKDQVKQGDKVKVTVVTSTDVDYITINGQTITKYKSNKRLGQRTWTMELKADNAGEMEVDVIAYNSDDLASEPVTKIVEVEAFAPEMVVSIDKKQIKEGNKVKVTIVTSDDVDYITVNGQAITKYKANKRSSQRTWNVELKAESAGEMAVEVIAYSSNDVASEAVVEFVAVEAKQKPQNSKKNTTEEILGWIFGMIFD